MTETIAKQPAKHGGLAWQKARRLLAPIGSQTRALEDWPESFTPDELARLQYPHEGTDPEKRKALSNQTAMLGVIKAAIEQGEIETAKREITVQLYKEVDAFRVLVRHPTPGQRVKVKAGEEVREIQTITRQGCRQWLEMEGETPSEHIGKWLDDALQTAAPERARKVDAESETILSKRISAIVDMARRLGYEPTLIAWGGKAAIERECLKDAGLFTASTFPKAWQSARDAGLIDVENSETYRKR